MWTRTEAAARARSDADYALLSTAPCRRREVVRTRTEAAASARSDADYAFLSTAPGRRREAVWTRTEAAARGRLCLLEYRPRQEAGSRVDSDGSCCSRWVGCGLRLLEYRPRQEAGSRRSEERRVGKECRL